MEEKDEIIASLRQQLQEALRKCSAQGAGNRSFEP